MIPAPTTTTSACTRLSSRSAQRQCDLHVQLLAWAIEIDLSRRPVRLAAVLLRPAIDGLVGAEDLRERALAPADLGECDLPGLQPLRAATLGNADLHRTVLFVVHRPVVEHERVAAFR